MTKTRNKARKPKVGSIDLQGLATVAREYFIDDLKQTEIAARHDATQSAVAHWLARARALGIVSIDVDEEFALTGNADPVVSRDLRNNFQLLECIVVDPAPYADADADADAKSDRLHTILANTSGARLKEWIQSGDHIAVGGGRAPTKIARFIRRNPPARPDIRITPLSGRIWVGSWQEDGPQNLQRPLDADDAARLLALAYEHEPGTRFSQIGHPLYGDEATVREIIQQECVFNVDGTWKTDRGLQPPVRALVGVGVLDPESGHRLSEVMKHLVAPTHLTWAASRVEKAIELTREKGLPFFGDVANRFFAALPLPQDFNDEHGLPHERVYETLQRKLDELNDRAIVMQWEHLRKIQKVWAIAGGESKLRVIWTLLLSRLLETDRSGSVINHLTVDVATARHLMKALSDFEKARPRTREWYAKVCAKIFV